MKADEAIRLTYSAIKSLIEPGKAAQPLPKTESSRFPEIYVFRHGQTFDNKNRVFSGWRETKLTPLGVEQANILNKKLKDKKIDVCITSDLLRAKETAKIVMKGKTVKFEEDTRIRERNYGDLNGSSKLKLLNEDPVRAVKIRRFFDDQPPGGESMKMVKKRVDEFCSELVKRMMKTGENIAISCHGNSMKMIRLYFEKMELVEALEQENPLGQDYAEYVVTNKGVEVSKIPERKKKAIRRREDRLLLR